ncbi:unknown [Tannerella sp. CAG:118]|nr:unknown [Tannerella sp. CAG:118]
MYECRYIEDITQERSVADKAESDYTTSYNSHADSGNADSPPCSDTRREERGGGCGG